MIRSLKFLDLWTWVWISGGPTLLEAVTQSGLSFTSAESLLPSPLWAHLSNIPPDISKYINKIIH